MTLARGVQPAHPVAVGRRRGAGPAVERSPTDPGERAITDPAPHGTRQECQEYVHSSEFVPAEQGTRVPQLARNERRDGRGVAVEEGAKSGVQWRGDAVAARVPHGTIAGTSIRKAP